MELRFWPEGRLLHAKENMAHCASVENLRRAMVQKKVIEGTALFSDPDHNLIVRLGAFTGIIPREEGAVGITDGSTRDIALLTRVGRPVCGVVIGFREDATPILSRRLAQEFAYEHMISHLHPGDILPATVTHMETFGVFVDIGCGIPSMLGIETLSVSRIRHPSQRFSSGQEIFVVVTGMNPDLRRIFLSHRELLGTWEENARQFSPGMTVTGIVRSVKDYGVFVELTPNLSGLAETTLPLKEGDRVSVYIKSIFPERMKLKLSVVQQLPPENHPHPLCYYLTEGHISRWQYAPVGCSKIGAVSVFTD